MFVLIGEVDDIVEIRGGFSVEEREERIALFDTERGARSWAEALRLKNVVRESFAPDRVFRQNSLLGGFESYRIEEVKEELPHFGV